MSQGQFLATIRNAMQMMFLWNLLARQRLALSRGLSHKMVFAWRHYKKGLLTTTNLIK
jgi:hypothetical protein